MELMNDPVMVATGHTYDRVCIERWLQQGNRTCPVTGMRLRHLELTPNFALRNAIQVPFEHAWSSVHGWTAFHCIHASMPGVIEYALITSCSAHPEKVNIC